MPQVSPATPSGEPRHRVSDFPSGFGGIARPFGCMALPGKRKLCRRRLVAAPLSFDGGYFSIRQGKPRRPLPENLLFFLCCRVTLLNLCCFSLSFPRSKTSSHCRRKPLLPPPSREHIPYIGNATIRCPQLIAALALNILRRHTEHFVCMPFAVTINLISITWQYFSAICFA